MRSIISVLAGAVLAACGVTQESRIDLTPQGGKADGSKTVSVGFGSQTDTYKWLDIQCQEFFSCDVKLEAYASDAVVIEHASAYFAHNPDATTYGINLVQANRLDNGESQPVGYFGAHAVKDASAPGGVRVWGSAESEAQREFVQAQDPDPNATIEIALAVTDDALKDGWIPMELTANATWW